MNGNNITEEELLIQKHLLEYRKIKITQEIRALESISMELSKEIKNLKFKLTDYCTHSWESYWLDGMIRCIKCAKIDDKDNI